MIESRQIHLRDFHPVAAAAASTTPNTSHPASGPTHSPTETTQKTPQTQIRHSVTPLATNIQGSRSLTPEEEFHKGLMLQRFENAKITNAGFVRLDEVPSTTQHMLSELLDQAVLRTLYSTHSSTEGGQIRISIFSYDPEQRPDGDAQWKIFTIYKPFIYAMMVDVYVTTAVRLFERLPVAPWELSLRDLAWVWNASEVLAFASNDEFRLRLPKIKVLTYKASGLKHVVFWTPVFGYDPENADLWSFDFPIRVGLYSTAVEITIPREDRLQPINEQDYIVQNHPKYTKRDFSQALRAARSMQARICALLGSEREGYHRCVRFSMSLQHHTTKRRQNLQLKYCQSGANYQGARLWKLKYIAAVDTTYLGWPRFTRLQVNGQPPLIPIRSAKNEDLLPVLYSILDFWVENGDMARSLEAGYRVADTVNDNIARGVPNQIPHAPGPENLYSTWFICARCRSAKPGQRSQLSDEEEPAICKLCSLKEPPEIRAHDQFGVRLLGHLRRDNNYRDLGLSAEQVLKLRNEIMEDIAARHLGPGIWDDTYIDQELHENGKFLL
jgi:hypothetical protein